MRRPQRRCLPHGGGLFNFSLSILFHSLPASLLVQFRTRVWGKCAHSVGANGHQRALLLGTGISWRREGRGCRDTKKAAAHTQPCSGFGRAAKEDNRVARRRRGNYCWSQPICSASRFVIRNSKTPGEFIAEGNTGSEKGRGRHRWRRRWFTTPFPTGRAEWRSCAGVSGLFRKAQRR